MPIDTSIYQTRPIAPPDQQPSVLDSMSKAYGVASMANQLRTQQGTQDAYRKNVDPNTGQVNQAGFLSDLGKVNPQAAMQMQSSIAESNKLQAEAQTAKLQAANATLDVAMPKMQYLAQMSPDDRARAFPSVMQDMKSDGVPTQNVPQTSDGQFVHDEDWFQRRLGEMHQSKSYLANQLQQSEIAKNTTEANMAPVKMNSELYGSRSPNAELSSQYAKDAAPLKGSQPPMKQMMDNYAHPSPQGDASLVLNAFKIKFPNAPDVNSLEELTKSQAAPDQWKQMANHAISGGLDKGTRDNLMRDGISTFRANYDSLNDVKDRYSARAQQQNVNDKSLTYEPAMDRTYKQAMALQDKIGPYVPPSERGGVSGALASVASKLAGTGGSQAASASDKQQSSYRPTGSSVSSDEIAQYAMKHGMKLSDAQTYLRSQGYAIGR